MLDAILSNLPRNKPQLWRNPTRALWRRLALAAAPRVAPGWLDRPRVVELAYPGLRMEVVPRDAIGRSVYLYGSFEERETRFMQTALRPGDLFVDVGANAGYYALLASRLVGEDGGVIAFEPSPAIRERLERNVRLNGLTNVSVSPQAVSLAEGEASFYESSDARNSGLGSLLVGAGRSADARKVPTTSLDALAATLLRGIDVLKIDVEGAELDVFAGGERLLSRADAPLVVFESSATAGSFSKLRSFGYEVRALCFDPGAGLRFDEDLAAADAFSSYEAPSYVGLKPSRGSFDELLARSVGVA